MAGQLPARAVTMRMKACVTVLAASPVAGVAHQALHSGLAHGGQEVAEHRHRVALGARRRDLIARVEEQVRHLPPGRVIGPQPGPLQRPVDLFVTTGGIGVGLGARDAVGAEQIGAGDRGADELAHAVGDACRARRRQDQAQQVLQEGAFGR